MVQIPHVYNGKYEMLYYDDQTQSSSPSHKREDREGEERNEMVDILCLWNVPMDEACDKKCTSVCSDLQFSWSLKEDLVRRRARLYFTQGSPDCNEYFIHNRSDRP